MKITEAHLRHLVMSLLTEAVPPPDEPGVASDEALGQYVFPNDRLHWVPATLEALLRAVGE